MDSKLPRDWPGPGFPIREQYESMGCPPTAHLVSEKWGQKNLRPPGLVHLFDLIFLINPAWAVRFRLSFAVVRPLAWAKEGGRKEAKNQAQNPAMISYP
jgi:hypothetical protein